MKTIRQIAEEIGIDKQRVYRHIKKYYINESHQNQGMMYFDDTVERRIKQHFLNNSTSSDTVADAVISMLKNELEAKNQLIDKQQRTINDLTATIKTQAENANYNHQKKKVYSDKKRIVTKAESAPMKRLMDKIS